MIISKPNFNAGRILFLAFTLLTGGLTELKASEKEYLLQLTVKPVNDPSAENGGYLRLKNIIGSWKVSKKNVFPDEDYDDLCMTIRTGFKQDKAQSYHEAMLKGSLGKLMQQKADIEKVIRNSNDKSEVSLSKSQLGMIKLFIHVRERAMSEIDTYLYWIDCVPLQDISSLNKLLNKPR